MSQASTITLVRTPTLGIEGERKPVAIDIPACLGPVTLQRELGRGAMGVVWLGRHTLLDKDVAVKFLLHAESSPADPSFTTFLQGAAAAAAVRHPALTQVLHADVVQGVPYIVMEYVDGPTLAEVIARAGALPVGAVRVLIEQACEAVAALHEADIIHRDLKPANMLLRNDGGVVLTDFGLACSRRVILTGARMEVLAGSPSYMAPEMFDMVVSPRTDVYALGIAFFEMLTGRVPYEGDFETVRRSHIERDVPIEALPAPCAPLGDVIRRATARNHLFRTKSARHMLEALGDAVSRMDILNVNPARGHAEVISLIQRVRGHGGGNAADASLPEGTYYERLSTFAAKRRTDPQEAALPPPVEFVPEGTGCVRCAAPLGGLPVTARCPACLLLVRYTLRPEEYEAVAREPVRTPAERRAPEPATARPAPEGSTGYSWWERVRRRLGF